MCPLVGWREAMGRTIASRAGERERVAAGHLRPDVLDGIIDDMSTPAHGSATDWLAEDTPERLVVRLGALFPHSAICVFDKPSGRARIVRKLFFFPRRMLNVALGDIVDFEVVEVGPPFNSFDPRIVLRSGKRYWVSPAATLEETRDVARRVRAFLGLPK